MNTKTWRKRNPFTDEFLEQEAEWYGRPDGVKYVRPGGRVDDFLNVNYRPRADFEVPVMVRDGTTWMSLTWMEVQSSWLAILRANGDAATVGLGLGYFALRAVQKPEVKSFTVFEIDRSNIDWFRANFADREGFDKIKFVAGDALKTCKGFTFDTMFSDRYPAIGDDDVVSDARLFKSENEISDYRFWSYERCVADAYDWHSVIREEDLNDDHVLYFDYWKKTKLCELRRNNFSEYFIDEVLDAMDWDV